MALSSQDMQRWIEARGPYLYHIPEKGATSKILKQGLLPFNQVPGRLGTEAPWTPRRDHVYLGMRFVLHERLGGVYEEMLRVDLRLLSLEKLNPDEDAFWSDALMGAPLWQPGMDLEPPRETVRDADTHLDYLVAKHGAVPWDANGDAPDDVRPYASYGEWAEANDLGSNPEHTCLSLERCGTISYHGSVSPQALSAVGNVGSRSPQEPE